MAPKTWHCKSSNVFCCARWYRLAPRTLKRLYKIWGNWSNIGWLCIHEWWRHFWQLLAQIINMEIREPNNTKQGILEKTLGCSSSKNTHIQMHNMQIHCVTFFVLFRIPLSIHKHLILFSLYPLMYRMTHPAVVSSLLPIDNAQVACNTNNVKDILNKWWWPTHSGQ